MLEHAVSHATSNHPASEQGWSSRPWRADSQLTYVPTERSDPCENDSMHEIFLSDNKNSVKGDKAPKVIANALTPTTTGGSPVSHSESVLGRDVSAPLRVSALRIPRVVGAASPIVTPTRLPTPSLFVTPRPWTPRSMSHVTARSRDALSFPHLEYLMERAADVRLPSQDRCRALRAICRCLEVSNLSMPGSLAQELFVSSELLSGMTSSGSMSHTHPSHECLEHVTHAKHVQGWWMLARDQVSGFGLRVSHSGFGFW